ncbi:MAG: glycosyltransferase [Candidatus Kapabacteria bacterium]|nr:glycosyltransferase [Candidatus Kapabacteria bacterium]
MIRDGLSVCIITKNEEKMIRDCILSIKNIANEIILADTGSTDNTINIAKELGASIFHINWENDFSKARNFTLDQAKYEYILVIDADERIINPEEIELTLNNARNEIGGWLCELTSFSEREDGSKESYISNLLRMFRNKPFIRFSGCIHEQIIDSILKNNFKLENTNIKFDHLGYNLDSESMKLKQLRNLELLKEVVKTNSQDAYNLYQLSKTYLALKDLNNAELYIQESLKYVENSSSIKPQALNFGAITAYQMGNLHLAKTRALESLQVLKIQAFANFVLGEVENDFGNHLAAFEAYSNLNYALHNIDVTTKIVGDYHIPPEQLSFRLGRALIGLHRYDDAEKFFEEGNRIAPKDISNLVGLSNIRYFKQDYEGAKDILLVALKIDNTRQDIKKYLSQVENVLNAENKNVQSPVITLAMIVKNEEKMLDDCLESVKGLVDEIVIVDTGSTDKTLEIAQRHNAKIYHFPWVDDFAQARNEALKHSTGSWILYLDADERLNQIDNDKLKNHLKSLPEMIGGLLCTIESNHSNLTGETDMHRGGYPRIFKNIGYPKLKFQGRVHEQIAPSLRDAGYEFITSDIVINHLGYNQPREIMEKKVQRNYKMLLEHVKEEPVNGYAWFQLGQTLSQMNLTQEAEDAIRFAITCGNLSNSVYASAASSLSQFAGKKLQFEEALVWANKSLEKAPDQIYSLSLKAFALLKIGRLNEAKELFEYIIPKSENVSGVPLAGYDIVIDKNILLKGLNEAVEKLSKSL